MTCPDDAEAEDNEWQGFVKTVTKYIRLQMGITRDKMHEESSNIIDRISKIEGNLRNVDDQFSMMNRKMDMMHQVLLRIDNK